MPYRGVSPQTKLNATSYNTRIHVLEQIEYGPFARKYTCARVSYHEQSITLNSHTLSVANSTDYKYIIPRSKVSGIPSACVLHHIAYSTHNGRARVRILTLPHTAPYDHTGDGPVIPSYCEYTRLSLAGSITIIIRYAHHTYHLPTLGYDYPYQIRKAMYAHHTYTNHARAHFTSPHTAGTKPSYGA